MKLDWVSVIVNFIRKIERSSSYLFSCKQNTDKPGIPVVSNVSPGNSNHESLW